MTMSAALPPRPDFLADRLNFRRQSRKTGRPRLPQLISFLAVVTLVSLSPSMSHAGNMAYVPVGNAPVKGPADALVTIVMFLDFQCPFCRLAFRDLERLQAQHPKTVRLVFKHFPLPHHPMALAAAQAAAEAHDQGKFWLFQERVWKHARHLSPAVLRTIAVTVGMDLKRYDAAIKGGRHIDTIRADRAEGRTAGVSGTPTLFFNGRRLMGAKGLAAYRAATNMAMKQARKLLTRKGVTKKNLYETILKSAPRPAFISVIPPHGLASRSISPNRDRPLLGPRQAKLEVWFFSNPLCYDAKPLLRAWNTIKTRFGPRVAIRFFHHFPSRKRIYRQAALLAEQAHLQGRFFPFFWTVSQRRPHRIDELVAIAKAMGVADPRKALSSRNIKRKVMADLKLAAKLLPSRIRHPSSCTLVWIPPDTRRTRWFSTATFINDIARALDMSRRSASFAPPP